MKFSSSSWCFGDICDRTLSAFLWSRSLCLPLEPLPLPTCCVLHLTSRCLKDTDSGRASPVNLSSSPRIWLHLPACVFALRLWHQHLHYIFSLVIFLLLTSTSFLLHVRNDFCSYCAFCLPSCFSPVMDDSEWMARTCASGSSPWLLPGPDTVPEQLLDAQPGHSRLFSLTSNSIYCCEAGILKSSYPLALDPLVFSFLS